MHAVARQRKLWSLSSLMTEGFKLTLNGVQAPACDRLRSPTGPLAAQRVALGGPNSTPCQLAAHAWKRDI